MNDINEADAMRRAVCQSSFGDRSPITWRKPADNEGGTISVAPRQTLDLEGELADNEVLTYLQMLSPHDLRPALKPPIPLEVQELDQWSPLVRGTSLSLDPPMGSVTRARLA